MAESNVAAVLLRKIRNIPRKLHNIRTRVPGLVGFYREFKAVAGGPATWRLAWARNFGDGRPQAFRIADTSVLLRPLSPDVQVALDTLGSEYRMLTHLFPRDHNGLIVDAGGYIGTSAIALSRLFPQCKIVVIEPSSENFTLLRENVRPFANIMPLQSALVTQAQDAITLRNRGTGPWGYTVVEDPADRDAAVIESVSGVTLGAILDESGLARISLLKLDIEGAERQLFEQMPPALTESRAVFAELHDRIAPGCWSSFLAFSRDRVIVKSAGEKYLSLNPRAFGVP